MINLFVVFAIENGRRKKAAVPYAAMRQLQNGMQPNYRRAQGLHQKNEEMNDFPSFPFYAADWLADEKVQMMSMAGEGCYIRLLAYQWREGSIPADRSAIALLCKANDGSAIDEALAHFQQLSRNPGRLINKRLERERKKLEDFRKAKQMAGLAGADSRWHGHNSPLAKNASSSSSSSSYKNKSRDLYIGRTPSEFDPHFEEFWTQYPKEGRLAKKETRTKFIALCKRGELEEFKKGCQGYGDFLKHKRIVEHFEQTAMYAKTFLNGRWKEFVGFKYEAQL